MEGSHSELLGTVFPVEVRQSLAPATTQARLDEQDGVVYQPRWGGGGSGSIVHQEHGHQGIETPQNCEDSSVVGLVWVPDYCERCNVPKNAQLAHSFMGHLLASRPNKILAIDFTVLEASRSGIENVLVMTDVFTKYSLAFPTRDQRAEIVVGVLVTEWFYKLGIAGRIHSDEGRNFKSRMMQHLCDLYAIRKSRTTSSIQLVTASASSF